ncbi:MAG: hypothetical protein Q8941_16255 [Bacteroidota bacterium]|nr:hypothetical protein [Bacteroidota bacterium]
MKKILLTVLLGITFLSLRPPAFAISAPACIVTLNEPAASKPDPLNERLTQEFLSLTPQKYFELTGKRMSLSQKISLKLAQQKVKRMARKGKPVDLVAMSKGVDTSDFNLPGFVLGLILSLIGVLIVYLIDKTDANMIKWAWIGAGVGAVLILLALIL